MFLVHGRLRLTGQEPLNAEHSQPPLLQLIKVVLRACICQFNNLTRLRQKANLNPLNEPITF
jgi:hypothetical protein